MKHKIRIIFLRYFFFIWQRRQNVWFGFQQTNRRHIRKKVRHRETNTQSKRKREKRWKRAGKLRACLLQLDVQSHFYHFLLFKWLCSLTDSRHLCVIFSFVLVQCSSNFQFNSGLSFGVSISTSDVWWSGQRDEEGESHTCVRERNRRNRFDSLVDWRWHEMYYFFFRKTKSIEHCRQPEWVACTWTRCSPVFTCRIHKKNISNSDSERVRCSPLRQMCTLVLRLRHVYEIRCDSPHGLCVRKRMETNWDVRANRMRTRN